MPAWMNINPFLTLSESISAFSMQVFLIVMVVLVIGGTVLDMIHKKNVKYFFNNAKKLKEVSKRKVGAVETVTIVTKTVAHDVLTSAEFCGWTVDQCNEYLPMLELRWAPAIERGWLKTSGRSRVDVIL